MIQNIENGGGFRGASNYTVEKVGSEPIGGNMAGRTPRELAAEFRVVRALPPEVEMVVLHASLSAPIGESVTEAQWVAIADRYAERMGFGDSAYVVVRHLDTAHDHVHLIASRIDAYGRVVSDQWDRYTGQEVLRVIEREQQLTPVRSSWDPARAPRARQLGAQLTGVPNERALTQIAERTLGLAPAALDELQRGLSLVQRQVLGQARALVREAVLGRERDDGLGL